MGSRTLAEATQVVDDFYRRTGAKYGPLGVPLGDLERTDDGHYERLHQLGAMKLTSLGADPIAETYYLADITLSGIRCYGTQDNGPDETFAIISLISVNPNHSGGDKLTKTILTPVAENVTVPATLFKMMTLDSLVPVGSGIIIHVSIWDRESGNADDIAKQVSKVIEDAVQKSAAALSAAALSAGAASSDPNVSGGIIGKITDFEVGGIKPFHILTLGIGKLIGNALADDLIGENSFFIPAANIVELSDPATFQSSIRKTPDLPFDVQVNWPPKPEQEPLFTDGHGTYKAFFLIKGATLTISIAPKLN